MSLDRNLYLAYITKYCW